MQAAEDETSEPQLDAVPNIAEATGYQNYQNKHRLQYSEMGAPTKNTCRHALQVLAAAASPKES